MFDLGLRCDYFFSMKGDEAPICERDVFVGITQDKIQLAASFKPEYANQSKKFIELKNQVVLPGLVNGHTHLPMTLLRGLEDDLPLKEWLFDRIFPLEGALVLPEFVRAGTRLAAAELIRFGVTTVCDMYHYSGVIADVLDEVGLRAIVTQAFIDHPSPEDRVGKDTFQSFIRLHERLKGHSRLTAGLGPHTPYTCSEETLAKVAKFSVKYQSPISIHVSETLSEVSDSVAKFGETPVARLERLGFFDYHSIFAHAVYCDEKDQDILQKHRVGVAYNPDSNSKLGSGIAPITRYLERGIPVAFGTDGAVSNNDLSLFGAMDLGTKIQKLHARNNTAMTAKSAVRMATREGARALGLEKEIGTLEVGKKADLISIDLDFPHLMPVHDLVSHLVYATQGLEVDTVIVDGKILLREKKHTTVDLNDLREEVECETAKVRAFIKN